jgi:uncharacterized membrane protein (UPF0127 family)
MVQAPNATFHLRNERTGDLLATKVEAAFDSETRRRGLLGRNEFPEGSALIIAPSNGIHTFFMRIAIDVVFASRDGRVIKMYRSMPAWRIAFAFFAYAAIELPAGTLSRLDTRRNDRLALRADELH